METILRYTLFSLFILPMLFMAVVALFSAILVVSDLPFGD